MTTAKTNAVVWSATNKSLVNVIIDYNGYMPIYLFHEKNNPVDPDAVAIITSLPEYAVGEGRGTIKINNEECIIVCYVSRSSKNKKLIINSLKTKDDGLIYARLIYKRYEEYVSYILEIPNLKEKTKQQKRRAKLLRLIAENEQPEHY